MTSKQDSDDRCPMCGLPNDDCWCNERGVARERTAGKTEEGKNRE